MIEIAMGFGMGFLTACLLIVAVVPLVHGRAVRLTTRKLLAEIPVSLVETQANEDLLRAEFAMSAYRLEQRMEEMRARATAQLADIGRQAAEIARLKTELGRQSALVLARRAPKQKREAITRTVATLVLFGSYYLRRARLLQGLGSGLQRVDAPPLQNIANVSALPRMENLLGTVSPLEPASVGASLEGRGDRDPLADVDLALDQMLVAVAAPVSLPRSLN